MIMLYVILSNVVSLTLEMVLLAKAMLLQLAVIDTQSDMKTTSHVAVY